MEKNIEEKARVLFERLRENGSTGRLGKTFCTDKNYYFLDTGTGKVAKLKINVYLVIKKILESDDYCDILRLPLTAEDFLDALNEIDLAIKTENILSANPVQTLTGDAVEKLDEILANGIQNITLEVTEKCNLRCKYCIYNTSHEEYREFGTRNMSWDVAKKAVDFLSDHSTHAQNCHIGFYGGEPLINFELIKKVVKYAKEKMEGITFALTTNAVLMTEEIAQFFFDNDFSVIISLDGPQDVHDENRVLKDGTGSFNKTVEGAKKIIKMYHENGKTSKIGFNIVTTGPNYLEKYDKIQAFIETEDWIPKDIFILTSGEDVGPRESPYFLPQSQEERKYIEGAFEPLSKWEREHKKDKKPLFTDGVMDKGMLIIHKRILTDKPVARYGMNGCCVPGERRVYVTVDGKFLHCEKVGNIPDIGNVDQGLDKDKIRKLYVNDFISEATKYCKNCWAVNLCTLCYVSCYDQKGTHFEYRHNPCRVERQYLENNLIRYHSILETDPKSLSHYNDVELT